MITLSMHSVDESLQRVYFKGSNKILYCLQQQDRYGNMDLMICSKSGEPENCIRYKSLFTFDDSLSKKTDGGIIQSAKLYEMHLELGKIKIQTNNNTFTLVESYRDHLIAHSHGTIAVIDPAQSKIYIPSMDDSKLSGERKFDQNMNTVQGAKAYIDAMLGEAKLSIEIPNFNSAGQIINTRLVELTCDQISDVISHSVQLVCTDQDEDVLEELKEALDVYGVLKPKKTTSLEP